MRYSALKNTKDVIIQTLREYFANLDNYAYLIPPQFDKDHFQNIAIWDTEPEELRTLPLLVIISGVGDMITGGLGDMAQEVYDPITGEIIAYKYGGMYNFNLSIEVGTRGTLEREFLADLVTKALRFTLRRKIESQGVLIHNARYGGESVVNYGSDHIYVATINIGTWSEWYEDVELLPMNDKPNINQ